MGKYTMTPELAAWNAAQTKGVGTVDTSNRLRDSLAWHAKMDVRTPDDRDFQVMVLLTRSRKLDKNYKGLIKAMRSTIGQDPRKPRI